LSFSTLSKVSRVERHGGRDCAPDRRIDGPPFTLVAFLRMSALISIARSDAAVGGKERGRAGCNKNHDAAFVSR